MIGSKKYKAGKGKLIRGLSIQSGFLKRKTTGAQNQVWSAGIQGTSECKEIPRCLCAVQCGHLLAAGVCKDAMDSSAMFKTWDFISFFLLLPNLLFLLSSHRKQHHHESSTQAGSSDLSCTGCQCFLYCGCVVDHQNKFMIVVISSNVVFPFVLS